MQTGCAALEDQRVAVPHEFADARADRLLARTACHHAPLERRLVEALGQHDATVYLDEQTIGDQRLDVTADGLVGNLEAAGKISDRAGALLADEPQDFGLALGGEHRAETGRWRPV